MTLDRTDDLARVSFHRGGGLLEDINNRQLDIRELIAEARTADGDDKTVEGGLVSQLGYPDEVIVATVIAAMEMDKNPEREVTHLDLIWAGAYLDHLDTQGFEVRRKRDDRPV